MRNRLTTLSLIAVMLSAIAFLLAIANCLQAYAYDGEIDVPGAECIEPFEDDPLTIATVDTAQAVSGSDFMTLGIIKYNGRTESWYSSNVLWHYRTPEWWTDDEGFYHDADGYYVVAASDYAEGSIIETSRGLAIVLDGGCDAGVTDFYTCF